MTAYVHIGTVKTGTTSIQSFLVKNRDRLRQKKYFHPVCCSGVESWRLFHLVKALDEKMRRNRFEELRLSLEGKAEEEIVLLSSECIHEFLYDIEEICEFKRILKDLGFNKIFIVVYLREPFELVTSFYNTELLLRRKERYGLFETWKDAISYGLHIADHKKSIQNWGEVFGRENLIVRLFDKNEFYQGDLLKDFIHSIGLEWDDEFIVPSKENETIDLLGIELTRSINNKLQNNHLKPILQRNFTSKDPHLKFQPPKEVAQSYIDYFEESNEWVRKEFFPHKERLFPKKDLTSYKENYELKEMKPEYWDRIAEFIADIISTKNQNIADKTIIIQNKDKVIVNQTNQINSLQTTLKDNEARLIQAQNLNNILNKTIQEKDIIINSNTNQIDQLQNNIQKNSVQINQLQSKLSFQTQYGAAKSRIQNQLSYKLGQAMIINSKNIFGILFMPVYIISTLLSHRQEQKIYQEKIKKDPFLKLPSLESYPDYKEALKFKNQLSYKLGQALIKANKTWYKGGYIKLLLEIRKLKKEFKKK